MRFPKLSLSITMAVCLAAPVATSADEPKDDEHYIGVIDITEGDGTFTPSSRPADNFILDPDHFCALQYKYNPDNKAYELVYGETGTLTHISIKGKISDKDSVYNVVGISAEAFYGKSESNFPVKSRTQALETVEIGEGVTFIGNRAFKDATRLRTVKLPSTLYLICSDAFEGCTALEAIEVSEKLLPILRHHSPNLPFKAVK